MHFTSTFSSGGVETNLMIKMRALDRSLFDSRIGCFFRRGPFLEQAESLGMPIVEFPMARRVLHPRTLKVLWDIRRYLIRERIDILNVCHFNNYLPALATWRLRNTALIMTQQGLGAPDRARAIALAHRLAFPLAVRYEVNSLQLRDMLIRKLNVEPDRFFINYNGVEMERFEALPPKDKVREELGLPQDAKVVLCVSRPVVEKAIDVLLRAFVVIRRRHPDALLLVTGRGALEGEMRALMSELGLDDSAQLLGRRNDIPRLLAACDVGVLSSRSEGQPNALLEYMAAGKPAVSTRVGAVCDVIDDGQTGLIVPPEDPEALADAVCTVLEDSELAARFGQAGRERARTEFSPQALAKRMTDVYQAIVEETRNRRGRGR